MLKTSSRHVFKTSSRRLQDVFSLIIFCLPRRLQDVFKTSLQDVFKTSSKRLGRRKIVTLKTSSRHVLKTSSRRLENQQMFAGILKQTCRVWYPIFSSDFSSHNFRSTECLPHSFFPVCPRILAQSSTSTTNQT